MEWPAVIEAIAAFARWLFGRWLAPKQVSEGTYEAKAAEAKELAKPDAAQSVVVGEL